MAVRDKAVHAASERARYQRKRAETLIAAVPAPSDEPGRVEAATRAEIESLEIDRPASVEGALAMARILDTAVQWPQHASAHRRLEAAMADLRKAASGTRKARLSSVRKLNTRTG